MPNFRTLTNDWHDVSVWYRFQIDAGRISRLSRQICILNYIDNVEDVRSQTYFSVHDDTAMSEIDDICDYGTSCYVVSWTDACRGVARYGLGGFYDLSCWR